MTKTVTELMQNADGVTRADAMRDLVGRLRRYGDGLPGGILLMREAADVIESFCGHAHEPAAPRVKFEPLDCLLCKRPMAEHQVTTTCPPVGGESAEQEDNAHMCDDLGRMPVRG